MDLRQRTAYRGEDGELYKTVRPPRASVKVWKDETEDGVEATHVKVPISSTSEDRDGDEFAEEGLDRMIEQLQAGDVPMFLDHGISPETGFQDYRALEAVGGWKDGEKEDGVVYGIGALDPDMEAATELANRLENGVVPVGWSVGFIPHETESKGDEDGERFLEHDLLEVSSVGIPSNPDGVSASIAQAAKSYARTRGVDVDADALARSMTESLEKAIEKQSDDALELVADVIDTFLEETDADEPTVDDFASWVEDTKSDDELDAIMSVLSSYADEGDGSAEDSISELASWVSTQLEADDDEDDGEEEEGEGDDEDDGEEEEGEGDDEDDGEEEEGSEPEETDDEDDDGGATITTDDVDAIASAVGDAVGRELEEHREVLLEQLDTEPSETDEDDDSDDEDDEEEEDGVDDDGASTSSSPQPRAVASFGGHDDTETDDVDDDVDEKNTGEPAGPTFNPGNSQ